jgi:hypothetical protein
MIISSSVRKEGVARLKLQTAARRGLPGLLAWPVELSAHVKSASTRTVFYLRSCRLAHTAASSFTLFGSPACDLRIEGPFSSILYAL